MKLKEWITGRTRVIVNETERAIWLDKGQLRDILMPGEYWLPSRGHRLDLEWAELTEAVLVSSYETALFDRLPDIAAEQLTLVTTGPQEVAVIEQDGRVFQVLGPDQRLVLWTEAGPWTATVTDAVEDMVIKGPLLRRLTKTNLTGLATLATIADGETGLVFVDGVLDRVLKPGAYGFWRAGRSVEVKVIDGRVQALDVTGQELLTKDRVTIRINVTATYQVTDPVAAVTDVKDFQDVLYRSLQTVFRKELGAKTLDQILENKATVDALALDKIRADLAKIGVEVSDITLKDVVLPGEMRDILNTVVAAEKQAEASVIKRREETNATRSLLNTAKVIAENPVMLRLKELEALETIAGKVERLTVTNGTDGLLNDLVKLRDEA
ncbi:MAG: slipin family protein [Alphaproteobacteria bacterium]|nr:slipin family protein [Alphaproteobacteria bacterium SS10]